MTANPSPTLPGTGLPIKPSRHRNGYSLRQAAGELGITDKTLARWMACGNGPKCYRMNHGTGRVTVRIPTAEFEAFKKKIGSG